MIEARIFGEEPIEHGAEQEDAGTFERLLVDRHGDLDPACGPDAAALAEATHDRPAVDIADATNAAFGSDVGHLREHRQRFAQRLSIATGAALDQTEMVGAKQVDEPPGDRAGMCRLAAAAQLRDDRLAWRRRAGDANEIEREIVDQAKIGSAGPDRQMLGQVPIRAQRPHAQLGDGGVVVGAAELAQRDEHIRPGIIR